MTRMVSETAAAMVANAELAARTAGDIQLMGELVGVPTTLIDGWRAQASARHDPLLDSLLPGVAEVVNRGETDAAALMGLATRSTKRLKSPCALSSARSEMVRTAAKGMA